MNQRDSDVPAKAKKSSVGPLAVIGLAFFGLLLSGHLLAFLKLLATDGYAVASQQAPVGFVVLLIVAGLGYLILMFYLKDTGQKDASQIMRWVGIAVVGLVIFAALPTCGSKSRDASDIYYRP